MLNTIHRYISDNGLPLPPTPLIVALSGGADSVALLLLLKQLGYAVIAAHCNFHLRGEESNRDEHFVRKLCGRQRVRLYVQHFNTVATAQKEGISIEMAARDLRYNWFEELRQTTNAQAIAVAHHRDDNAETILLNLIRGTGLHGLKGMLPINGHIIRPLLEVSRKELEAYLKSQGQDFVTDSTNLELVYKRNKIRHEVLPLLRLLNPAIDKRLAQTARTLAESEILYDFAVTEIQKKIVEPLSDGIQIHIQTLEQQPAPSTILHETLKNYGFSTAEIDLMSQRLHLQTGKIFEAKNYIAVIHRGYLVVRLRPQIILGTPLREGESIQLPNGGNLKIERMSRDDLGEIPKSPHCVAIDAEKLQGKLCYRSTKEGERFQPFGMKGSQLVSDYFTNRHKSIIDKLAACCICDNEGIVWLVNERVAQRVAITNTTQEVLRLTFEFTRP